MEPFDTTDRLTRAELARELVDLFDELESHEINEVLAKNVPFDTLEFFSSYADAFGDLESITGETRKRLPNLLLLGYLLRLLEERLLGDTENYDA